MTAATYGVPIAARVPEDLKEAARAAAAAGQWEDLSTIVRLGLGLALKLGQAEATRALARLEAGEELLGAPATSHRIGLPAERTAAARASRTAGAARLEVLRLAEAAGGNGITADEVVRELGHRWAVNGLPRRVTDLYQAGALMPARSHHDGAILHRATRTGTPATVYVVTETGRAAIAAGAAPQPPQHRRKDRAA